MKQKRIAGRQTNIPVTIKRKQSECNLKLEEKDELPVTGFKSHSEVLIAK